MATKGSGKSPDIPDGNSGQEWVLDAYRALEPRVSRLGPSSVYVRWASPIVAAQFFLHTYVTNSRSSLVFSRIYESYLILRRRTI